MNRFLDLFLKLRRGFNLNDKEGLHVVCEPTPEMTSSDDGYVHFSVVTTIAEEASWWALQEEHAVPSNVSVSLLRPANIADGVITGIGRVLRKGKGIMVAEGETWQKGKMICKVTATFVRFEKKAADPVHQYPDDHTG